MPSKNDKSKKRKESGIARWWRETVGELRKVTWPTRKEAWQTTRVVLIVMVLVGTFLALMDALFTQLVALLLT